LILDEEEGYSVVAWSIPKVFGYFDASAPSIDWKTAKIYENIDGHIALLYWYKGQWIVASLGIPDANEPVSFKDMPRRSFFTKKFWEIWKTCGYTLPTNTLQCYTFQMIWNGFRKIVRYDDNLILISARDLPTLTELDIGLISVRYNLYVRITSFV
jgi:hypothetical protein